MAQNGGYYHGQGQPVQPVQPPQPQYQQVYQQPQNIYQQLGKPQPQQHLQGHPSYAHPSPQGQGFQISQPQYANQQPGQYQQPYQAPQTPYQQQQAPYTASHTPFLPSRTPFAPPPPQPSPFMQAQVPYQAHQTPYVPAQPVYQHQQPPLQQQYAPVQSQPLQGQQSTMFGSNNLPISSFPNHTPSALSNPAGPVSRPLSTFRPPPVSPSASLAQQVQSHTQPLNQISAQQSQIRPSPHQTIQGHSPISSQPPQRPQVQTSITLAQGPLSAQGSPTKVPATPTSSGARRPLPQPSPGANAKPPTLPPVMQRVPNLAAFASSSPGTSTPTGSAMNQPIVATTFNKQFPAAASQDLQSSPPERRTPSPTRNSRPLPNPGAANKRATVDLGKPSSSSFSYAGNSTSGSNSPTKSGFAALPTPPSLGSPTKSTDNSRNAPSTPGSSRTSIYSVSRIGSSTDTSTASGTTVATKRRASPPRFTPNSASQLGSSPSTPLKESTPSTWGKLNSNPTPVLTQARNAALSSGSGSVATPPQMASSQSYPMSSATMANATEGSSKKFTPMWKRTIPEVPAPVWGFAAGMVSEPHPKQRTKPTAATTPSTAPNPGTSPTKNGGNKLMKKRKSLSTSPVKAVPQTNAYIQHSPPKQQVYYQQPLSQPSHHAAPSSYAKGAYSSGAKPALGRRNQPETSTEEEETEGTEEDGEEEETTEEDEDEDPRYHIPSRRAQPQPQPPRMDHRRHYSQPLANDDEERRRAQTRSHSRGRQAYSQDQYEFDEEDDDDETPRKAPPRVRKVLRLKDRVDPYAGYEDISPIGSSRVLKNIRPKALDTEEDVDDGYGNTPRKRILRRDEVEISRKNDRGSGFVEKGRSAAANSKPIKHQRSFSAIEEREMQIRKARKSRHEPERERPRPGSAFARRGYEDEEDEEEDEDEDSGLAYDGEDQQEERRRGKAKAKNYGAKRQTSSPSYGIHEIPPANMNRRVANESTNSNHSRYDNEHFDDVGNNRPPLPPRGRSGLPEPPSMGREAYGSQSGSGMDRNSQGAPKWKTSTTSLKYDKSAEEDQRRRFEAMNINGHNNHPQNSRSDSRMSGMSNASGTSAGSGAWPQDLPRLPRTPGSANTPGTGGYHDSQTGYFDNVQPQQSNFSERQRRSQSQGPPAHPSRSGSSTNNLYLDDPPPQASVMRTPSPGPTGGFTFQKRPQSQAFEHHHAPNLPRRPQSQIYGNTNVQQQAAPFHQRQPPPPQHPQSRGLGGQSPGAGSHLGFGRQQRQQPQTPAPPPTVGIESPYPVGGRERMADIPKMEIDSEHGSDHENAQRSPGMIPSINVESDASGPSRSRSQSIPAIHIDSSPQMKHQNSNVPMINVDGPPPIKVNGSSRKPPPREVDNRSSAPRIQVFEVPGVSVSGPGFDEGPGGPVINVSGPDDHNQQSHSQHNHGQRPPSHGSSYSSGFVQQPRSGGLFCGGCHNAITNGRIVSAMGARWHPSCFKCTVCNTLLEHVSSFEHEGRPYCHLDYHESFAPRCYSCKTAIIDEQFISLDDPALGKRTYHTQHFFCAECGDPFLDPSAPLSTDANGELALSGDGDFEGFTVYKGYPYCEACHVRLRLPKCRRCKKAIRDHEEAVEALGGKWCWGCFTCAGCENPFENPSFFQRDDKPYCEHCFSIILRNEV